MLLVITDAMPSGFVEELECLDHPWKLLLAHEVQVDASWNATILVTQTIEEASNYSNALRSRNVETGPVIAVFPTAEIPVFTATSSVATFDDFALLPLRTGELAARVSSQLDRNEPQVGDVVSYGAVELNVATYQASVAGRLLDMTYMEYELLRYFVTNSQRVLSREQLLKEVWKYEYYGGARTVDVHVRRLRAKLGEEHAQLIQTVRSVGYLFGRER